MNGGRTTPRPGPFIGLLKGFWRLTTGVANGLAKPIIVRRLAPIDIPFRPGPAAPGNPPLAAPRGGGDPPTPDGGDGENAEEKEDDFVMPGGSAGWGPVSGGYWGLDGQFHEWSDGVPPLPPPWPPLPPAGSGGDPAPDPAPADPEPAPTAEEEAAEEERQRRIRELEEEMFRILEEMQIMWPLLEDLLKEEFEARRREILELDPDWRMPGTGPAPDDDDMEAPPLDDPDPFEDPPDPFGNH